MSESTTHQVEVPEQPTRLIRIREVQYRTGLGRSTIYRWMAEGKFPKSVQLGGHSVAWVEQDVHAWIQARSH
ncbi:MAG: AlpA family transcriptional regulator [Sphingomonadaceae bacterium]|jgi:prophage regulatory protein|nr:AlpA family transcriptional regulator [Sphingomonadaceae bacterium]